MWPRGSLDSGQGVLLDGEMDHPTKTEKVADANHPSVGQFAMGVI